MSDTNSTRPPFSSEFVASYSMGQYDYIRFNSWLEFIERYSAEINSCEVPNIQMVQNYFAGLNVLYKCWKSLIYSKVQKELDDDFSKAKKDKRIWESQLRSGMPTNKILILRLVDTLDNIHTHLMEIKQLIGLGIEVKRKMTTEQKIKAGIKGLNDFKDLPEA